MENKKGTVKKIYGKENLKEILTELIEKTFIQEIENMKNSKQ